MGIFGVLKAGGAYVPMDPAYPAEHLRYILEDTRAPVVLTQQGVLDHLPQDGPPSFCLDRDWDTVDAQSPENLTDQPNTDSLAYLIYTSGSTGRPKGVMVEHGSLANYTQVACREYDIRASDRVLQFASFSFDASCEEIFPALTSGATLVLRTETMLDSVSTFLSKCLEWGVTVVDLPTAYWHELTAHLAVVDVPPSIRLVIIGGESAQLEAFSEWRRHVGSAVRLVNTYGPTETTIVATMCDLTTGFDNCSVVPIGRPIPTTRVHVLDSELRPVAAGETGELYVGGVCVTRGYLNRPDLTAERFVPDPFDGQDGRLYRTGDLVRYLPDLNLEFMGRVDHQVKIRGFRIELGAIESVLRQQDTVRDAVVLAREDRVGDKRLVAYVVAASDQSAAPLYDAVKATLPPYMVPSAIVFLPALPLTPAGKIDRRSLPPPSADDRPGGEPYIAPRSPIEDQLAHIWEDVLDVPRIGMRDNFFDLGGNSLLAAQLVARVEAEYGRTVRISSLADNGTVEHMAAIFRTPEQNEQRSPLMTVQSGGSKLPFFYVHGDRVFGGLYCWGLARHLGPDRPFYVFEPHGTPWYPVPVPLSVEAIAESYLSLLRQTRPSGPYLLGGFCSGALVALEMAHRLRESGEKVELVAMVDPELATRRGIRIRTTIEHGASLLRLDSEGAARAYVLLRRYSSWTGRHVRDLRRRLRALAKRGPKNVPAPVGPDPGNGPWMDSPYTPEDRERLARYDWVDSGYRIKPYSGRVIVLQAEDGADNLDVTLFSSSVEVRTVPGNHLTFITRHLADFARVLGQCLDSVEPDPSQREDLQSAVR